MISPEEACRRIDAIRNNLDVAFGILKALDADLVRLRRLVIPSDGEELEAMYRAEDSFDTRQQAIRMIEST